jgi:hypothetical protein
VSNRQTAQRKPTLQDLPIAWEFEPNLSRVAALTSTSTPGPTRPLHTLRKAAFAAGQSDTARGGAQLVWVWIWR